MQTLRNFRASSVPMRFSLLLGAILTLLCAGIFAQTTISTGSIQGTVTDPTGAVVSSANVSITDKATGQVITTKTNSSGVYQSGALIPGNYVVRVETSGFKSTVIPITVQVGNTANGNAKLEVGQASETVQVEAGEVAVNTEQATVQGVLTADQIENLPVNGRNFLDLAQLEPGVQIQDGTNFDPTKVGYSSISFGGRFGRTARIEVDGVDVSDETVGTTTEDIPASAIQEFQLSQSKLDLSNELTSSGAVNVTTKSGTNGYHGEAFGFFRDHNAVAASLPTPAGLNSPSFSRDQFGANFGGPIIKDKLFFFGDAERTLNNLQSPVALPAPFAADSGFFNAPFRESELDGRLDYQLPKGARLFYRFNYFDNWTDATFFASSFQVYKNKDDTRSHVLGLDFNTGSFTHLIRFEYLKFQNQIVNGDAGQPFSSSGLSVFNGPFAGGPNFLAPQSTPQSDHELKYDGTKAIHTHIIRFGMAYNHIQGGGFASFFSIAPVVISSPSGPNSLGCTVVGPTCPAGPDGTAASNPLNYDVQAITIGNGVGFSTLQKAFGFPAGGLGPDNRIAFYLGDSWRAKPNLTVELGLRYVRDTGRQDSDLPGISQLNNLTPDFPNLGGKINQPNLDFAPQIGIAWDPTRTGKTVLRAGAGLYYENTIWNNVLFDRPTREPFGAFLQTAGLCASAGAPGPPVPVPGGSLAVPNGVCGNNGAPITILQAAPNIIAFEQKYQSDYPFTPTLPNGGYIPSLLSAGLGIGSNAAPATFAPNFMTPRSFQMNLGIQHEIRQGMVFSADYVRNVETRSLLGIDLNHTGDARYFNSAGALAAIAATNAAYSGCAGTGSASIDCAIKAGATMANYAANGLDTSSELSVGGCPAAGCAFPGLNPKVANLNFLLPVGRSVYNAMDLKLVENVNNPMRGLKLANFQFSYSLSKFVNPGGANPTTPPSNYIQGEDQDFVIGAADNANPLRYMGPSTLDRTHQFSFGGDFGLPAGFQTGIIAHFYSPLATPLVAPNTQAGDGEIFRTDFTGDGSTQDFLPGTKNGAFMRGISPSGLSRVIGNYNNTVAGQATPAGQDLISNGLFSLSQLQKLGGVAPTLPMPIGNAVGLAWLRDVDLSFSWKYTIREKVTLQPGIGFFNVFNFANFDLPPNILSPYLLSAAGSVGATTYGQQQNVRVGEGTGVYGLGAPRVAEFSLKISF
jgi:hypothetical protein